MKEQDYKWRPLEIDPSAFLKFIRSRGASSIYEIKNHFHTDSRSVRRAIAVLLYKDKVWLVAHQGGIYVTENTGKKGKPNVAKLRKDAGVVERRGRPRKKPVVVRDEKIRRKAAQLQVELGDPYE